MVTGSIPVIPSGYRLMVNYLPSKQRLWVQVPLSAYPQSKTEPTMRQPQFKVVRQVRERIWPHAHLTPKQIQLLRRLKTQTKTNRKQSDFARDLINKRKLTLFYGHRKSLPLAKLETRLDVLLVRAQFCSTLFTAKQLILHRQIRVNAHICTSPNYSVSQGDMVSINASLLQTLNSHSKTTPPFNPVNARLKQSPSTVHLEINNKIGSFVLLYEPKRIVFPYKVHLD